MLIDEIRNKIDSDKVIKKGPNFFSILIKETEVKFEQDLTPCLGGAEFQFDEVTINVVVKSDDYEISKITKNINGEYFYSQTPSKPMSLNDAIKAATPDIFSVISVYSQL
ncbi:hypothetical protein [Yersinia kristensenii]|uniref:Uncharacterized protein n=1 Tax=Yersinia kristensenii TaxID=28152 RepID=A0AB73P1E5_YERKR|nr:hypothetical protein [Yersinia kristensenii]OVZ83864.1 hypothetical protein CBW52_01710 [Yersinia kristensenii]